MENEKKEELTEEEKLALIKKYERKYKAGKDINILREKNKKGVNDNSLNICDKHWDGA